MADMICHKVYELLMSILMFVIKFIQGWIQQGFSRGVLGEQPSVSL
jgi:hypothetical protein